MRGKKLVVPFTKSGGGGGEYVSQAQIYRVRWGRGEGAGGYLELYPPPPQEKKDNKIRNNLNLSLMLDN